MSREYLGTGIKYPHEVNTFGRIQIVSGGELVKQSINVLLETPLGSDFDNPGRGSRLRLALFEPNDEVLQSLLYTYIEEAVALEKRVRFKGVSFTYENNRPELVYCIISYLILASNEVDSLIYPFYRKLSS